MAIKSADKKPTTAYVMRYAHPFFTSTPHATRPQTPFGKRMLDWAKQQLGPIPKPVRAGKMGLAEIIGDKGVSEISKAGEIRFHATGDTGNLHSQSAENVSQQMAADFDVNHPGQNPAFLFHLGDVIYGPHKSASYRDEFYRPYKGYPGKIIAVPGNHDGETFPGTDPTSLQAFLDNFCAKSAAVPPAAAAARILRETMTQPGVYWWLDSPFLDLIGLYSNFAEGPGFLEGGPANKRDTQQITWLTTALETIAASRKGGPRKALMIATHHPPFSNGGDHGGSPDLLAEIDKACGQAGIGPDAFLSSHSHTYQRYSRQTTIAGKTAQVPYVVCGVGGRGLQSVPTATGRVNNNVSFEKSASEFGYLLVIVSAHSLQIEFCTETSGSKKPFDSVKVAL